MRHYLAAAVLAVVAVPGLARIAAAPPVPRAEKICFQAAVSGLVNQSTPPGVCVDTPFMVDPLHPSVTVPGVVTVEVWTNYPSR